MVEATNSGSGLYVQISLPDIDAATCLQDAKHRPPENGVHVPSRFLIYLVSKRSIIVIIIKIRSPPRPSHVATPTTCSIVKRIVVLQLRIDPPTHLRLRLIVFHAVVPAMHCARAQGCAPAIPGCCCSFESVLLLAESEWKLRGMKSIPAMTGALGCQLASLTHVCHDPPLRPKKSYVSASRSGSRGLEFFVASSTFTFPANVASIFQIYTDPS